MSNLGIKIWIAIAFFNTSLITSGQTPQVQDCMGAIPICQMTYDETNPKNFLGKGNYNNEINQYDSCITAGDSGTWYIFTAQSNGLLKFTITPHDLTNDYDWIVFDITKGSCKDLATKSQDYSVSSNTFGYSTVGDSIIPGFTPYTGANSDSVKHYISGKAGNCNGPGSETGPPFNDDIQLKKGNIYLLFISNWSATKEGYNIDFDASTASITDNSGPFLKSLSKIPTCNDNTLTVMISENVSCKSVSKADFSLTHNGVPIAIINISSQNCLSGAASTRDFILELDNSLSDGDYILSLSGQIDDACGNTTVTNSLPFSTGNFQINNVSSNNSLMCFGDATGNIIINAQSSTGSIQYSIDGGQSFKTDGQFRNLKAGTYEIVLKNENGCTKIADTINITEPDKIKINNVVTNDALCYNEATGEITIEAEGGTGLLTFSLNNENNFKNNAGLFKSLKAGEYMIKIKDANSCLVESNKITINNPDQIEINEIKITPVSDCQGNANGQIKIDATGGTGKLKYSYDGLIFQDGNIFASLPAATYTISVQDENLCLRSQSAEVYTDFRDCLIRPTAFSPNSDGKNDTWKIGFIDYFPDAVVKIFDRDGNEILEYKPNEKDWDGKHNGSLLPVDTYYYLLILNDRFPPIKGNITIVR